jgi:hypothetical protein
LNFFSHSVKEHPFDFLGKIYSMLVEAELPNTPDSNGFKTAEIMPHFFALKSVGIIDGCVLR